MKKLNHKIKLVFSRVGWYSVLVKRAINYRKEIKDVDYIVKKQKELTMEMLTTERTDGNIEEINNLNAKISMLDEIIKICS